MCKFLLSLFAMAFLNGYSQPSVRAQSVAIRNTPLIQALLDHKTDRVLALLAAGADANDHDQRVDNGHKSALALALSGPKTTPDKVKLVSALLGHGADSNARYDEGTPLFQVGDASPLDVKITRLLLDHGADPSAHDRNGKPLLLHFAQVKDNATVALTLTAMLLEKGVGVDTIDQNGITALDLAACGGSASIADFLLDHGADVNHLDSSGKTPLLWACSRYGNARTLRLLLQHGASLTARDKVGQSALALAIVWHPDADKLVRVLLDHGAEVDARDNYGQTALMKASNHLHAATTRLLLYRGADVNATDQNGFTPLMYAVTGFIVIDPELAAIGGHTATKRDIDILPIVKLLLQHKAHINQHSRREHTVLSLAQGARGVTNLLRSLGAKELQRSHPLSSEVRRDPGPTP